MSDAIPAVDEAVDQLCSIQEIARMLHISEVAAWRLVDHGDLPAFRVGKAAIRVPVPAVYSYITANFVRAKTPAKPSLRTAEKPSGRVRQPATRAVEEAVSGS